jgi:hypothetical protein
VNLGVVDRWQRWTAFLDQRESGTSLALFRIACGLGVLLSVGGIALYGLVPVLWLNPTDGGYRTLDDPPWLFHLLGGVTPGTVWSVVAIALIAGAMLTAGLAARISALVALQAYLNLLEINPQIAGGDDLMLANALWLLVLAQSSATLSLDCRLRTGSWTSAEPIPAWPRYLAIYQLVLTYWSTGVQKLGINWLPVGDYSALYYILQIPSWQRGDMTWLASVYPLTQFATALTWTWENAAPLLLLALWYRNTPERPGWLRRFFNWINFRGLYVIVGLGLHLGILLLMNVEPFTWVTLSYYVCLFRPSEWNCKLRIGDCRLKENQRSKPWIAFLRATFIAMHLFAISVMAFPCPVGAVVDPDVWKTADIQEDVAAWSARLGVAPEALQEHIIAWATTYIDIDQCVQAPFEPYYKYCGTYQSWNMFGSAPRTATRLHIDVEENGVWRPVYIERDPEHAWLARWFDHCRFRPVLKRLGAGHYPATIPAFADWAARQAARDFPSATRVRVRFFEFRTPAPAEVRAGQQPAGHFHSEIVAGFH